MIIIINDDNNNNNHMIMLGRGALPPLHPPCWPAVGRRRVSSASPFGHLILIMIMIIMNNNDRIMLGGGALPFPAPLLLAALRPAGNLERLHEIRK